MPRAWLSMPTVYLGKVDGESGDFIGIKGGEIMNYTNGRWYVALNGKVLVKHSHDNYTQICQMPFSSAREADEMPEANSNSQLIAAAPDMYEALQAIIDKRMECHETEAALIPHEIELAYKALAKAGNNKEVIS